MSELLIRGGTLIDGTGSPGRPADLLIRNGHIVSIGTDIRAASAEVIDARGYVVTPGFIDSHTHFDPSLFWDPLAEMAQHGVTTVLIGNCSLGLAPLHAADRSAVADLFAFIEDVPRETFDTLVAWNWETFDQYLTAMRGGEYAVNIAALVSHSMLRQYVMGDEAWTRVAAADEIDAIARELGDALDAGAIGMSSSFFDRDGAGRRVPSFYADDAEFDRLFAVLGSHKAVFQVIPQHPEMADVCSDLERMGGFAAKYGVKFFSNAIGDMPSAPGNAATLLSCARRIRAAGAEFQHMLSPRSIELSINFHQTMTFMTMPVWNEIIAADAAVKRALLADGGWRTRARAEWDTAKSFLFPTNEISRIRIIAVGNSALDAWLGRSLAELVAERAGHPSDVLADWVLETGLEAQFVVPMNNFDPDKVGALMLQPEVVISGSDAGAHFQMFCGVGDTTLVLTRHVREHGHLTLEAAIRKLTLDQANLLGLNDRGILLAGKVADIAIFALDELEWKHEVMVHDIPGGLPRFARPAGNFRFTIVNGEIVQESGRDMGARPADILPVRENVLQ